MNTTCISSVIFICLHQMPIHAYFWHFFANFDTIRKTFTKSAHIILIPDDTFVPNMTFLSLLGPEILFGEKTHPTRHTHTPSLFRHPCTKDQISHFVRNISVTLARTQNSRPRPGVEDTDCNFYVYTTINNTKWLLLRRVVKIAKWLLLRLVLKIATWLLLRHDHFTSSTMLTRNFNISYVWCLFS